MKRTFFWISLLFFAFTKKEKPDYQLFTSEGKATDADKMLKDLSGADVILFGELHNDSIAHALQFQVAQSLYKEHNQLVLGSEMFEADVQLVLDEYLNGQIPERNFEAESRPWPNYKTDYKPLITFAKENKLKVIATNVPRRYAAAVANFGVESLAALSPEAKQFMPPLPFSLNYELPGYKNMLTMFGDVHGDNQKGNRMIAAQALKDATMAHFILKNLASGHKFLHLNGAYHSDNFEGIYWYLKQQKPYLKIKTISTVTQKDLKKLEKENRRKADFILVVPENAPKSN